MCTIHVIRCRYGIVKGAFSILQIKYSNACNKSMSYCVWKSELTRLRHFDRTQNCWKVWVWFCAWKAHVRQLNPFSILMLFKRISQLYGLWFWSMPMLAKWTESVIAQLNSTSSKRDKERKILAQTQTHNQCVKYENGIIFERYRL